MKERSDTCPPCIGLSQLLRCSDDVLHVGIPWSDWLNGRRFPLYPGAVPDAHDRSQTLFSTRASFEEVRAWYRDVLSASGDVSRDAIGRERATFSVGTGSMVLRIELTAAVSGDPYGNTEIAFFCARACGN